MADPIPNDDAAVVAATKERAFPQLPEVLNRYGIGMTRGPFWDYEVPEGAEMRQLWSDAFQAWNIASGTKGEGMDELIGRRLGTYLSLPITHWPEDIVGDHPARRSLIWKIVREVSEEYGREAGLQMNAALKLDPRRVGNLSSIFDVFQNLTVIYAFAPFQDEVRGRPLDIATIILRTRDYLYAMLAPESHGFDNTPLASILKARAGYFEKAEWLYDRLERGQFEGNGLEGFKKLNEAGVLPVILGASDEELSFVLMREGSDLDVDEGSPRYAEALRQDREKRQQRLEQLQEEFPELVGYVMECAKQYRCIVQEDKIRKELCEEFGESDGRSMYTALKESGMMPILLQADEEEFLDMLREEGVALPSDQGQRNRMLAREQAVRTSRFVSPPDGLREPLEFLCGANRTQYSELTDDERLVFAMKASLFAVAIFEVIRKSAAGETDFRGLRDFVAEIIRLPLDDAAAASILRIYYEQFVPAERR